MNGKFDGKVEGVRLIRRSALLVVTRILLCWLLFVHAVGSPAQSPSPAASIKDFGRDAANLGETGLPGIEPQMSLPIVSSTDIYLHLPGGRYRWKADIVTEVFWVGEPGGGSGSVWDPNWEKHYGGVDNPKRSARKDYRPVDFTPGLNSFYCELPYNDVIGNTTKPEARLVIPWFRQSFTKDGESVCRNRWVEIRNQSGRTCYAQWSECGPVGRDLWQYVFGNDRPAWNIRQGVGLGVSPAVRDFLGLSEPDVTSWRFVDFSEVPTGPWSYYGSNNDFVIKEPSRQRVELLPR